MEGLKKIRSALISVYYKSGLEEIIKELNDQGVSIISTGGTKVYIERLNVKVTNVEDLTTYPSILGGRVKTLHPKIFGGILARRDSEDDKNELKKLDIKEIDLVIVDLYPFEETVKSGADEEEIIEKIDIGGISLIRAAAKNFNDVLTISSQTQYNKFNSLLVKNKGEFSLAERKDFAIEAFSISSHYDTAIFNHFNNDYFRAFKTSVLNSRSLRYGENPHQKGRFFGNFDELFEQLHGKEISYNNILDIDAAASLIADFDETTVAILKHNNACGAASREDLTQAWKDALAGDPLSAFGGIIIANRTIHSETAEEINRIFFELIIAPAYDADALEILKQKKNRMILRQKKQIRQEYVFRSALNGILLQEKDLMNETPQDMKAVTNKAPTAKEIEDLLFANRLVKHSKSNSIVLVINKQLVASGVGETSRVDALKHAIEKAKNFGFDLNGAVMASDAFFPFADSIEIAHNAGVKSVIQPGGSIRDNETIEYCNKNNISMVFTGIRHFKH